ncbi:MAG: DUF3883 domain-containing protein [Verrucomicrobia bacterium]|nr:DUF3883 domain-containing protein [Verrucomicrobiota bacterium]MCH8512263.1 DUF3883 domain-containing protein [Kiritimatiellia bacterium]
MPKLEDIIVGASVSGMIPGETVSIQHAKMIGSQAVNVTFVDARGKTGSMLLYRSDEHRLNVECRSRTLSLSADANAFRLAAEAQRIRWAHLFDPMVAVNTSSVTPLPHQVTAVYDTMLTRQPLRFLLADDPGAGKTIMTGLLVKELVIRGDISKCLIVAPGSIVEQWQDELDQKFNLPFDILTKEGQESSRTGNWFLEHNFCLVRLDKLSRDEELQEKVKQVDWDLVIVDEAHKMAATYFGGEIKRTKRFRLGQLLSRHTRQFLLLTATPHNGKDEDFQLFLSLLDGDRFEGRMRDGVHSVDASDLMRRMVKEQLVTMEGKPLFPPRYAYTLEYTLSDQEAKLYRAVTEYVREEFNRADNMESGRKGTVGFALTILQRRLASSPEAIYQSLRRRRERLEKRVREEKILKRGAELRKIQLTGAPDLDEEAVEDIEDLPGHEFEEMEERILDLATASVTIGELEKEIATLKSLEKQAAAVKNAGTDSKWIKLADALHKNDKMKDAHGRQRKLIIFTEHRDTLNYLRKKLLAMVPSADAIQVIHGQVTREQRRAIQEMFSNDPECLILLATDAAGEGINLQRAHLMVNYDLPWNPNRLEQRFGRIHRIGQRETCHLWNLVAGETREGDVYLRLLQKIEAEREALGDAVFDVLGEAFKDTPLKDLLLKAIRFNESDETEVWLNQVIDENLDHSKLRRLVDERAISPEQFDQARIQSLCERMQRAEARKLQPHYIGSFFEEAFSSFGGKLLKRESRRFEIRHVPLDIRRRDRVVGIRAPLPKAMERVTFEKEAVRVDGHPPAALIAPGHPLLDATISLVLERHRETLRQGTILVDPADTVSQPRLLLFLESAVHDGRPDTASGGNHVLSRLLQFVELYPDGRLVDAGYAPYLDYTSPTSEQLEDAKTLLNESWLSADLEEKAVEYAIEHLVPDHLDGVRERREALIEKTREQVRRRLESEIRYWDARAIELREREEAGNSRSKLNSQNAQQRAEDLAERLSLRLEELDRQRNIMATPPVVHGGALVVPACWFTEITAEPGVVREKPPMYGRDNQASELLGMEAVMASELEMGFIPRDVSAEHVGYDIESLDPDTGKLRFLEVKARAAGADTVTLTRNEILTGLNRPDQWWLVIVPIENGAAETPVYVHQPFADGIAFSAASMNLSMKKLLAKGRNG